MATQYRTSGNSVGKTVPGALQFKELVSRHPRECRYDVTCMNERLDIGPSTDSDAGDEDDAAWAALLAAVDALVKPVLREADGADGASRHEHAAESVGFVLSQPGAPLQQWHPDDGLKVGLFNVFVPLLDLTSANGGTELALATHTAGMQDVARRALRRDYG
eukprot:4424755-Prymnesium_polylepis.1